jgi:hypothetical protein
MSARRVFSFEALEARLALAANPVITEFMASNSSTLLDGNGVASDWIEIYNKGDQAVNLAGYSLTDDRLDLDKWTFPSVTLNPGAYLVVFASGNGTPDPGGNLHTNFALSASGEYLALASPGGVVLSQFGINGQDYPAQTSDVSYGLAFDSATSNPVTPTSSARYLVPTNNSVDATWMNSSFNDASWTAGTASIGYETSGNDFAGLIQTAVPPGTTSVYIRIPFTVTSSSTLLDKLQMKYDDGFVAYLNGQRIASANAPQSPGFASVATDQHVDSLAVQYVDFPVSSFSNLLHTGTNVLAIHLLNNSSGSSDLLSVPNLTLSSGTLIEPPTEGFTTAPTPRAPNASLQADPVLFSRAGGAFSAPFQLTLSTASAGNTIRYTTDGSQPQANSPIYTTPITISATTRVRARAFGPIGQISAVSSEAYTLASSAASAVTSDLPIIVLENFGQGTPGGVFEDAWFSLYDVASGNGRSSLASTSTFSTFIGQQVRGSSTAGDPKTNLRIELRNDAGADKAASLLGMPSESDWILYAPYSFDRAMLRNTLYYDLSNQMGNYAARTRFVEVYANYDNGVLDSNDYMGVYVLMENIKRDSNRVDIAELSGADITGGYILKLDRSDGTPDSSWYTERGVPTLQDSTLVHVEPERAEMTVAQRDYIRGYVQDFEDALYGPNSTDPTLGYQAYFDVDKSIDHHLLRVLSKEPDGLRLSTYLVKDAGGKLYFGPVWDFDRSAGADNDGRSADPTGWYLPDVDFFESDWWGKLFDDPNFTQKWVDRWQELRRGVLSDANILATVNGQAADIAESQARNFARWPEVAPNGGTYATPGLTGWAAEVSHFANWLITRAHWMDDQMIRRPSLSPAAGNVQPNTVVTLTSNQSGAAIYYTLDGSDPRASGGGISPTAILYTGPFVVSQTTQVIARANGTPGPAVPQGNSSYPGDESPIRALDGNPSTKYLNFGEQNSGLIITPASGASIVRSMRLTTANDAVERDPTSYEIWGTNSLISSADNSTGLAENWTLISSGTLSLPDSRGADGPLVSFANSTSYTSYKILFPTVKNTAAANSMQIADIRLYQTSGGTGTQIQSSADGVRAVHVGTQSGNTGTSPWSERIVALYSVETPASASNLRVTELHYHPADPTPAELALAPGTADGDYEFLELRNTSAGVISLNGVEISGGIEFKFNNGTITSLQPGAYVLVVSNLTAFTARYGSGLPVAGQYSGQLSNGGEALLVSDAAQLPINDFTFDDVAPWPTAADGGGPSMEVVNLSGNYNSGTNWRASATPGGNPGRAANAPGDFNGSGVVDGADFLAWQRGFGSAYYAVDLSIWRANYGSGAPAAAMAVTAPTPPATTGTSEAAALTMAITAVELPSETAKRADAAGHEGAGRPALTYGQWWLTAPSGEVPSSVSRREANHSTKTADAVLAEWTPCRRNSSVGDELSAKLKDTDLEGERDFTTLERRQDGQRSLSHRDETPLKLRDQVIDAWNIV